MNLADLNFSFSVMQWIVMSVIGVYSWLIGRQAASAKELLELRTRLTTLEAQLHSVPSSADLASLAGDVKGLRSDVQSLRDVAAAQARATERINSYLLGQK